MTAILCICVVGWLLTSIIVETDEMGIDPLGFGGYLKFLGHFMNLVFWFLVFSLLLLIRLMILNCYV